MKRRMKKTILLVLFMTMFFACNDRLEDLNQPRKNATSAPADNLFANGVRNMFDLMASTDVNSNVFRLFSQYWAQTTYPDESQYNLVGREIADNFWTSAYRDVLMDLEQAEVSLEANWQRLAMDEAVKNNQMAIIHLNQAYMFAILVDAFGAIPFDEALREDVLTPKYEAGEDVYNKVFEMIDNALGMIDVEAAAFPESQDPVYGGDVQQWIKFGNSLKLRMAVNISDVNPTRAATLIQEALTGGVFESNADNASITYYTEAPNTNPVWEDLVQSGRADYVIANTIVDQMLELEDPRLPVYADPMEDGTFIGGEYGTANTYDDYSKIGGLFHEPDLEGVILDYSEINFLLAEAAEKGLVTGDAADYYEMGIRASMEYWGVPEEEIEGYLARPDVAYATAEGDWKQKIGIQSWIAQYNRGFEGWTTWRRLDFTGFNVPEGLTEQDIPRRMTFPIQEATLNPTSFRGAVELIGGSDDVQTRVFWDAQ
jgi:hypothetical protein